MNPLADLAGSLRGWGELLAGKPGAGRYFRATPGGIAMASGYFVLALLLSVAAQSIGAGMPGLAQVIFGLLAQAATVAILGIAMAQTLRFLNLGVPLATLLVPALYALAYSFALSIPLLLVGPGAGLIALVLLGFMLYRLGRGLAGMRRGVAAAFAVLCVLVLVAVPNALYMLVSLLPQTA